MGSGSVDPAGELDLGRLHRFDMTLRELLVRFPIDAGVQPTLRSERLLRIRHELAASGHLAVTASSGQARDELCRDDEVPRWRGLTAQ